MKNPALNLLGDEGEAEQGQLQESVCVSLILTHFAFTDTGNQKQSLTVLLCTPL